MKKGSLALALAALVVVSPPLSAAEGGGDWLGAFRAAFASGLDASFPSSRPPEAVLGLAARIGEVEFSSLEPAEAASLSLRLAASMHDRLRSGLAMQEVRARSRQEARILLRYRTVAGGSGDGLTSLLRLRIRQGGESRRDRFEHLEDPLGQRQDRHGADDMRAR